MAKKYRCWIPDYGHEREDGRDVDAFDAEQAAARFMEFYEAKSSEYPVASGGEAVVAVSTDGGEPEMYSVQGEAVPSYRAWRKRDAN